MDSTGLDEIGDCIKDISAEQLLSIECSDTNDVFGDPEVLPRVGDTYQVDIPLLMKQSDYLLYTKNPIDAENRVGFPRDFLMGKPIPVMWITKEVKHEKLEFDDDPNDASNKSRPSEFIGPGDSVVPGSCGDSWSDIEKASLLLGLYVFEKNFVQVERFIEEKNMGDILSFYYGKFYKSDEYRRWSACRKMRSKKSVYGQRIFSGLRQQELLSRMLPRVSEECQNALLKVSKKFGLGKMLLEDYVSSLKTIVGMQILVEAVGIGKGKKDITGITMESLKPNQALNIRPEIPTGKAFSSLTPREIVKFLSGDYRLSKARSNDLFWEAVWPRLLARGWQSEEPKNQIYTVSSKHSLVFLTPGIEKFSRRRLVKGTQYFDSVADVLSKVASEPGLLELDIEEDEGDQRKEEHVWTNEEKLEQDDLPERRRHCYLQPRTPIRNTDVMRFTIVDTSLAADGKNLKVRELSTLPVEISKIISLSEDSDGDDCEVSTDEESEYSYPMLVDNMKPSRTIADCKMASNRKCLDISANGPNSSNEGLKRSYKRKQTIKDVKSQSSRRPKQDNLDILGPVVKRHRQLSICSQTETLDLTRSQVGSSQDSPIESIEGGVPDDNSHGEEPIRLLIDLHIDQESNDGRTGVSVMETAEGQDGQTSNEPHDICIPKDSVGETSLEQEPNVNSRRHSTRNRPPTVRALEALANGYLTTNRRRKGNETSTRDSNRLRTPRRARTGVGATEFFTGNGSVVEGENGTCNGGNSNMFGEFPVSSKGKGSQISGP